LPISLFFKTHFPESPPGLLPATSF
jgi:hypothetical protein